jgi:prophage maintenance system killer protein
LYLTKVKTSIDSIIEQFFYIIKEQCFNDGNKRTAILVTNVLLLKKNIGFLELDLDKMQLFSETIFKYDHNKIKLKEATQIIKDNFIVVNILDRKQKITIQDNKEKIYEIEESLRTFNLSKNQLAKMLDCDASNLNRILSFKVKPSIRIAKLIGDILKID